MSNREVFERELTEFIRSLQVEEPIRTDMMSHFGYFFGLAVGDHPRNVVMEKGIWRHGYMTHDIFQGLIEVLSIPDEIAKEIWESNSLEN